MDRLFKIESVYRSKIAAKNVGEPDRDKVEVTLTYHETTYSSQTGPALRRQFVQVTMFDEAARQCQLVAGQWIVGSVSLMAFPSRNAQEQGRMMTACYLDRYVVVTDWNVM